MFVFMSIPFYQYLCIKTNGYKKCPLSKSLFCSTSLQHSKTRLAGCRGLDQGYLLILGGILYRLTEKICS